MSIPHGVYVWLEGIDIGTRTEESGEFLLRLPADQGGMGSLDGMFSLYFYMANYGLEVSKVFIRGGEVVPSRGDINKDGRLGSTKVLRRYLRIYTTLNPSSVGSGYADPIEVSVTLKTINDSVTVVVPKTFNPSLLGAILLRRLEVNNVKIIRSAPNFEPDGKLILGVNASATIKMSFNLVNTGLPVGPYEVVPYLLLAHQVVPEGLMESLGSNVEALSSDYLKIPFQREGGEFTIQ